MASKVCVALRIRPLIDREKGKEIFWTPLGTNLIEQRNPLTSAPVGLPHSFDHVFSMDQGTQLVYDKVVSPIVNEAFSGFNGSVLCYGQTSSGKTHTLFGNEKEQGIIHLAAQHLFDRIKSDDARSYIIRVGLLEIYNEKVTDLLDPGKKEVQIVEQSGVVVPKDLEEIKIVKPEDILQAAQRIQRERKVGETAMNKESSRSHTILRILIESVPKVENEEDFQVTNAVLHFVDLAGSEKAGQTLAQGERFKEATYINMSLHVLSNVVKQLCENSDSSNSSASFLNTSSRSLSTKSSIQSSSKKASSSLKYVNYRDSKLTRILQSSLSGNAFISMICNVTPASLEETLSTIRFAKLAKNISVQPTPNLVITGNTEYQQKIKELTSLLCGKSSEVEDLKKQLEVYSRFCRTDKLFHGFAVPAVPGIPIPAVNKIITIRKTIHTSSLPLGKSAGPLSLSSRSFMPIIPETNVSSGLKRKASSNQSSPEKLPDEETFQPSSEISFFSDLIRRDSWEGNAGLLSPQALKLRKFDREVQTDDEVFGTPTPSKKPKLDPSSSTPKNMPVHTPSRIYKTLRLGLLQASEDQEKELKDLREFKENELEIAEMRNEELSIELEEIKIKCGDLQRRNKELEGVLAEYGELSEIKNQLNVLKREIEKMYETVDRGSNTESKDLRDFATNTDELPGIEMKDSREIATNTVVSPVETQDSSSNTTTDNQPVMIEFGTNTLAPEVKEFGTNTAQQPEIRECGTNTPKKPEQMPL